MSMKSIDETKVLVGNQDVYLLEDVYLDPDADYSSDFNVDEEVAELLHEIQSDAFPPLENINGVVSVPKDFEGVILKENGAFYTSVEEFAESHKLKVKELELG